MYKIYKQAMQVYIIFMHADLAKFAISRILHAPTQNDESFPTIWRWNIWTKIVNILTTTTTLQPPGGARRGCQHSFDIEMWTQREHLETEILQNSSELGNQY